MAYSIIMQTTCCGQGQEIPDVCRKAAERAVKDAVSFPKGDRP